MTYLAMMLPGRAATSLLFVTVLAMGALWSTSAAAQSFRETVGAGLQKPTHVADPVERCVVRAASFYQVDPNYVRAILVVEGGQPGTKSRNRNGTHDYGLMQVNTWWIKQPGMEGIDLHMLRNDICTNIFVGTWILATEIRDAGGDIWKGVGNYHSRTPKFHNRYRRKARQAYKKIVASQQKRVAKEPVGISSLEGRIASSGDSNG